MSKLMLFVCLVFFGSVLGQTQIRLLNAKYFVAPIGLAADLVFGNSTLSTSGVTGALDNPAPSFPNSPYIPLPRFEFAVGTPIVLSAFDRDFYVEGPIEGSLGEGLNVTLDELQSYSVVYFGQTDEFLDPRSPISDMIILVEERPNPSPVGKALVRVVNCAVSTFDPAVDMNVVITGNGVPQRNVSLAFGTASDFLEYDTAVPLTLATSLPIADDNTRARTIDLTPEIGYTTMVYIRGDYPNTAQLGQVVNNVEFAFPAPPSTAPVAGPTAPVAAPTTGGEPSAPGTAPTAAAPGTAPVSAPSRAPTRRVSSAAQTVAQIAGVAGIMSLLF